MQLCEGKVSDGCDIYHFWKFGNLRARDVFLLVSPLQNGDGSASETEYWEVDELTQEADTTTITHSYGSIGVVEENK